MENISLVNRVELRNIAKSFGGISALKDVTLKAMPGEIHALMGENGAGKSTLMKILSGVHQKDKGQIFIDGEEAHIKNTYDSKQLGIGIIYQEFSLVPELSVAENIFLNRLGENGSWLKFDKLKKDAGQLIESIGFNIDPAVKVSSLSIAQQQVVEIAKALSENVKVLILDEPSAVLGPTEVQKLFDTLFKLKSEGVAIIFISHHLSEIFQIADRVTVIKDGASSETLDVASTNKDAIIKMMLGRTLNAMFPPRATVIGQEVLRVEEISIANKVKGVSFAVKEGEVLGIAGLVGSGRTETIRAVFAADQRSGGDIFMYGKKMNFHSPSDAVKHGIGMVPEDRKLQGVILSLPIKQNISLTNFKDISNVSGFINADKETDQTDDLIKKLVIKALSGNLAAGKLSGGNQQKVVLAKWLNTNCKVMIIDEPTRGVDVGAKVEIYTLINELSRQGVATIVISSETAELMGICDRILVMREGKVHGELDKTEFTEENILRLSIGAQ
ncbi:sugar ABC transporter ATP-binding protein [Pedobacter cryoconitis]|uniref:sugar ABC transporter ATP-binding protein n=1 Tax=Pedobacter cryoconitis TaxID=188932 RepID=UPI00161ADFEF|nr:sugar ABC transporter ATP-binding protein [Pedobacter cryoconitis]MBB5644686.1 ribose transport system ATP-binding protein [Pedobacter cryoconitis]